MAGSKSDYLENKVLDAVLGQVSLPSIPTVWVGLYTVAPTDAGGGTEVSGGAYERKSVTNNVTNFPAASGGAKSNGTEIIFVEATGSWGTVLAFGIFDAVTAGNLLYWADLTTPKAIGAGDTAKFAVGDLDLTED